MDPAVKAQRQLEVIEGQVAQLETRAGADHEARLQLKHLRCMKMVEKFGRPIFTFVDTPGAAALVDDVLFKHFNELKHQPVQQLLDGRYNKFRQMAQFYTE